MTAEVRRLAAALVDALFLPVERRVWRRLLDVTEAFATGAESVSLPITQEMLAQLAGTTRSSANKVLRPAEDQGMIAMRRGHIDVLDLDALRRRAR
jgi:CRP-like cAMP-binding protein